MCEETEALVIALWAWQITNRVALARTGLELRQFGSKLQLPLRQTSTAQMIFAKSLEGLDAGCPFQSDLAIAGRER